MSRVTWVFERKLGNQHFVYQDVITWEILVDKTGQGNRPTTLSLELEHKLVAGTELLLLESEEVANRDVEAQMWGAPTSSASSADYSNDSYSLDRKQ